MLNILNILKRIAAGAFVLGMLVVAVAQSQSEPQDDVEPPTVNPQPVASYVKPVEMPTYNPVKPDPKPAKGHFEKRYVEGAWRFVWFADGVKKAPVVQKKTVSSGNCANGQCYAPSRRGLGRRR